MTTAQLNGHPVPVHQVHRRWTASDYVLGAPEMDGYEPVVVTVTAPIGLSVEDVAAVLFDWNVPYEDLADDHIVRDLIAEAVVNWGCRQLEELRARLGERTNLTSEDSAYLAYCRQRATAVFAPCTTVPGRALVGVR
jgi:hypothetical protein